MVAYGPQCHRIVNNRNECKREPQPVKLFLVPARPDPDNQAQRQSNEAVKSCAPQHHDLIMQLAKAQGSVLTLEQKCVFYQPEQISRRFLEMFIRVVMRVAL